MGQRLNIEIWKGGEVLANAYYHWSAYTETALRMCEHIIQQYENIQVGPSETCDSEVYKEKLASNEALNRHFGGGPITVTKVTMPGTYAVEDKDRLLAIRLLESTGAGVNEEERARIRRKGMCPGITFRTAINRNAGLLSVTPEGINNTREWDEGRVVIDLDDKHVNFGVFYTDDFDTFIEECGINPDEEADAVPVEMDDIDIDIGDFAFDDIDKAIDLVWKSLDTGAILRDGTVYAWIM